MNNMAAYILKKFLLYCVETTLLLVKFVYLNKYKKIFKNFAGNLIYLKKYIYKRKNDNIM